jgi:xanthine dehydrogenase YagS FAD-binding subunit
MRSLKKFTHLNAKTIDEAVAALANGDAEVIAGGTDLFGKRRFSILNSDAATLINLKSIIPTLEYIKEDDGILKIGALTKLHDIAISDIVRSKYNALAQAAAKTASPHLREMGTIGGNICQLNRCWYFRKEDNRFDCIRKGGNMCYAMAGDNRYHSIFGAFKACLAVNPSDTAPALVALNAKVVTNKRTIAAEEFWTVAIPGSTVLEADEIVTEIQIPTPEDSIRSAFIKFAERTSIDFPIVNCAADIGDSEARICLNAVYNIPYRATAAEDSIKGQTIDETSSEAAAIAAMAAASAIAANGTNPGNKYKVQIAQALVKRTILACA